MKDQDIEERAKDALEKVKEYSKGKGLSFDEEINRYGGYIVGFKDAMKEERERGKRFAVYMFNELPNYTCFDPSRQLDSLFEEFLEKENNLTH